LPLVDPFEGRVALNYQIVGKLGQGAFGTVYRARHLELGREVAIKILLPQHSAKPDLIERFMREAKVVCDIGHDDIVAVENAGKLDTGEPFYMMELVEGRSLARVIAEDGPLTPARFARVFAPLASALAAAHDRQVVHRDLKPQNVMVREKHGEILGVKLLDFGIAKFLHEADADSHTGDAMGTPHYMAPEQVQDAKRVDARADVYAFAGTAFYSLSGQRPVTGATVTEVLHNVMMREPTRLMAVAPQWGPALSEAVAQCMARDPGQRPRGVREAWALLQRAMAARPTGAAVAMPGGGTLTAESHLGALTPTVPPVDPDDPSSASMRTPTIAGSLPATRTPATRRRRRALYGLGLGLAIVAAAGGSYVLRRGGLSGGGDDEISPRAVPALVADATPVVVVAPAPDASAVVPVVADAAVVVVSVPSAPPDAGPTRPSRRPSVPKPARSVAATPPPAAAPPPAAKPAPTLPAAACTKERFAAVYRLDKPTSQQVSEALLALIACRDAGYISQDDYSRIQAALVSK
jgi:tRNA A-37 threonylcarbamoyl transferase component Bud32